MLYRKRGWTPLIERGWRNCMVWDQSSSRTCDDEQRTEKLFPLGIVYTITEWQVRAFNNLLVQAQFLTESPNSFDSIFLVVSMMLSLIFFPKLSVNLFSIELRLMVLKHVCDDQGDSVLITMADRPSAPYWSTLYLKFKFRCKSIVWFRQTMARQWEGDIITRIFQLHFKRVMRRAYWLQAGCEWLIGCLPPQEVQNLDWGRHSKAVDAHRASLFNKIARRFPLCDWLTLWMRQADFESACSASTRLC